MGLGRGLRLVWRRSLGRRWEMRRTGLSKPVSLQQFCTSTFVLTIGCIFIDVHRFDAGAIPLQGPYGLIAAASRLLDTAGTLDERHKRALLDRFIRFVQENQ